MGSDMLELVSLVCGPIVVRLIALVALMVISAFIYHRFREE
jgi:hypothetical protein